MKSRLTVKSSLLALVASSVLLAGQVHAADTTTLTAQSEQTQQKSERAHGGKHHGKSMHKSVRKMLRSLDLTETQRTDVRAIFDKYKAEKGERPSAEERAAHKAEMLALISNANFDDAQAEAIIDAKQLKQKEGMKNFMKMQNEIYQLLTEEQKAKFDSRFTKVKGKGRG
ncbi:Spy/CpxP family protein refolding chaperone [Shewanella olleyana]|uniref:Spy/CpxP family protein refolding chaperone n=1 Tax=Shewanella olleyana TaxID=135626 RepID=UPI00200D4F6C|nr:Spy/CpxP family protein refolding chaperone [Shewanella olleyana]MCL1066194.1 Spy/CpxP family protein refolding chaperone [Shewanella olleyana]